MRYLLLSTALLAGCVSRSAPKLAPMSPVEVALRLPTSTVFDRAVAAFTAEGLSVAQADRQRGTIKSAALRSGPVSVIGEPPVATEGEYFFHAAIAPASTGSLVRLHATGRSVLVGSRGNQASQEFELQECHQGNVPSGRSHFEQCQKTVAVVRSRLDQLAVRIRRGA